VVETNHSAYKGKGWGKKFGLHLGPNTLAQKWSQMFAPPAIKILHLRQLGTEQSKKLAEEEPF
jgi:hypothetical protein